MSIDAIESFESTTGMDESNMTLGFEAWGSMHMTPLPDSQSSSELPDLTIIDESPSAGPPDFLSTEFNTEPGLPLTEEFDGAIEGEPGLPLTENFDGNINNQPGSPLEVSPDAESESSTDADLSLPPGDERTDLDIVNGINSMEGIQTQGNKDYSGVDLENATERQANRLKEDNTNLNRSRAHGTVNDLKARQTAKTQGALNRGTVQVAKTIDGHAKEAESRGHSINSIDSDKPPHQAPNREKTEGSLRQAENERIGDKHLDIKKLRSISQDPARQDLLKDIYDKELQRKQRPSNRRL